MSVGSAGTEANAASSAPSISDDGRFVAFASEASNLAPDTNARSDIFVRDRQTNTTTLVSVKTGGGQTSDMGLGSYAPHISATGRFVLFTSDDAFAEQDTLRCGQFQERGCPDVYLHDREAGETMLVSLSSTGAATASDSVGLGVSGDGRFILFESPGSLTPENPPPVGAAMGLYVRDRQAQTTTRIGSGRMFGPRMSDDGQVVVFAKLIEYSTDEDASHCAALPCRIVYVYESATLTRTRLSVGTDEPKQFRPIEDVPHAISADGRHVLFLRTFTQGDLIQHRSLLQDRLSGRSSAYTGRTDRARLALSANGRHEVAAWDLNAPGHPDLTLLDHLLAIPDVPRSIAPTGAVDVDINADGRFIVLSSERTDLVEADTNAVSDIFVVDTDRDGDGTATWWETAFNLNPDEPADGAADSDGDGQTNAQEYAAGTHPRGTQTRYLAEGAINAFFSTRISFVTENSNLRPIILRFLGSNGVVRGLLTSATQFPISLGVVGLDPALPGYNTIPLPDDSFSTIVESEAPLTVERTMWWGEGGYGAHAETAIVAPSLTWYLAEGATGGPFDLFYLLQNANSTPAQVTIEYLRPSPAPVLSKTYTLAPNSRRTIWVNEEDAALVGTDVSAKITADVPVIVERSMYLTRPGQPFAAGHGGAGVTAPATRWFLAEGATGSFFDLYALVANAETSDAQVRLTYLLPDGSRFSADHVVGRQSRRTFFIDTEDPRLENTPVSIIVESMNGVPIVVERAMWWPEGNWYEAHLSAGATTTGTTWALADGDLLPQIGKEAYILIANTSPSAGSATITLRSGSGDTTTRSVPLPANSRVTLWVSELFPELTGRFAAHIESDGVQIVVEGAMYASTPGTPWSAGTALLATRLQ